MNKELEDILQLYIAPMTSFNIEPARKDLLAWRDKAVKEARIDELQNLNKRFQETREVYVSGGSGAIALNSQVKDDLEARIKELEYDELPPHETYDENHFMGGKIE